MLPLLFNLSQKEIYENYKNSQILYEMVNAGLENTNARLNNPTYLYTNTSSTADFTKDHAFKTIRNFGLWMGGPILKKIHYKSKSLSVSVVTEY